MVEVLLAADVAALESLVLEFNLSEMILFIDSPRLPGHRLTAKTVVV